MELPAKLTALRNHCLGLNKASADPGCARVAWRLPQHPPSIENRSGRNRERPSRPVCGGMSAAFKRTTSINRELSYGITKSGCPRTAPVIICSVARLGERLLRRSCFCAPTARTSPARDLRFPTRLSGRKRWIDALSELIVCPAYRACRHV
jgi:hypothetical protein